MSQDWNGKSQCLLEVIKLMGVQVQCIRRAILQLFATKTNDVIIVVIGKPFQFDVIHFRVQQFVEHLDYFREKGTLLRIV